MQSNAMPKRQLYAYDRCAFACGDDGRMHPCKQPADAGIHDPSRPSRFHHEFQPVRLRGAKRLLYALAVFPAYLVMMAFNDHNSLIDWWQTL